MNILQINASSRRDGANSTRVANNIVEGLAMGPDAAAKGFAQAQADLDAALA